MKKIVYYAFIMFIVVILIPMLIVRGCSLSAPESKPEDYGKDEDIKVKVYINTEDKVVEMPLEEYIKQVVAAEMPAEFGIEALKAQAVVARTYTYGRMNKVYVPKDDTHKGADICTDPAHCQAWISKQDAMKKWGIFSGYKYWNKIDRAVNETRHAILTYEGQVINALFHSNSGGKTENAEEVWGGKSVPYLRSVASMGEEAYDDFETTVFVKEKDFRALLKNEYPDIQFGEDIMKDIKIIDYTEGGRVRNIKVGSLELKGTDIRRVFSLKSANFSIEREDDETLKITTIGYGHGVGMSQWGANYLAEKGYTYEEILKYYYKGVELEIISN